MILLTMLGINSVGSAQEKQDYTDVDVEGFAALLKKGDMQLLDVRTPEEYAQGHIAGASNINVFDPEFAREAKESLQKSRPVAVYCRSGKRSADAARILSSEGFKVTNLEGGILAWIKADEPVEK